MRITHRRRRPFFTAACCGLVGIMTFATSPVVASAPTTPLANAVLVLSAGSNGRNVIVVSSPGTETPHTQARRIDHLTGASTALPDLLAASADSSTIVTDDFRWINLDTDQTVPLPASVPHEYSSVVISSDGGTVAAREPLGQRNWIVDVDRAMGTASASLLPIAGVVQAISDGGRYLLIGTSCAPNPSFPSVVCRGSVRWDRRLGSVSSLGGPGRTIGLGIGVGGEVALLSVDGTTASVLVNQPRQPEQALANPAKGFPRIMPDAQTVLFVDPHSGFTGFSVYDRATASSVAVAASLSMPSPGAHSQRNGKLSTDGSTFVAVDAVKDVNGSYTYALLWTPVSVRPSTARVRAAEVFAVHVAGAGNVGVEASSAMLSVTVTDPSAAGFATVWPCGQQQPLASNLNFVAGQTRANAVLTRLGTNGDVCIASNVAINVVVDVQGWFGPGAGYHALTPTRIVDTRVGAGTTSGSVDTVSGLRVPLTASNTLGGNASAVMLNITATNAAADGFVTVWPCDTARPVTSNLNFAQGATAANAVLTGIGGSGDVCVSSNVATDIVIDVQGWFEPGPDYQATNPVRLVDTRNGELDNIGNQASEQTLTIPVAGIPGVDPAAAAAMLNLTITNPAQAGYATVWPCDQTRPLASNANFGAGETVAVAALVGMSEDGTICVATNTRSDIIVDLNGSLTTASSYLALTPNRLVDTRI